MVREALLDFGAPPDRLAVKWPNDVLADQKKIAGILVERVYTDEKAPSALIVGIGVNLKEPPDNIGQPASSLSQLIRKKTIGLSEFALHLDKHWRAWWDIYQSEGFEPVRQAWTRCANGLGEMATVSNGGKVQLKGRFTGIDHDGAALIDTGSGCQRVLAGDVQFRLTGREMPDP